MFGPLDFATVKFNYHGIGICLSLVLCHTESGQVLLDFLDQRTALLHQPIQGRDSSPLLHLQMGQGNSQVLIQDSLDLLIFSYDVLPYH